MSTVRTEVADGRKVGVLTRDDISDALREYARRYGPDFSQAAFSPAAAKRLGRPDLVERYYAGREDGRPWPSLNAIKSKQPHQSFNEARAAIGLPPNSTGPARGRRKAGEAEPILNVRERLVYVPDEKTKQLRARVNRLEERLTDALSSRDRWREEARALRSRPTPKIRVPEVRTKTVRVTDPKVERALAKAQTKLADETARANALGDQLRAEQRDRLRLSADLADMKAGVETAGKELREAQRERDAALDRLSALEAVVNQLRDELDEARKQAMGTHKAASSSQLVRRVELKAERAEVKAAKLERELAQQASLITGETRKLTPAEIAQLRKKGPTGPTPMAKALKKLASARSGYGDLDAALLEVAQAAMSWRDVL